MLILKECFKLNMICGYSKLVVNMKDKAKPRPDDNLVETRTNRL